MESHWRKLNRALDHIQGLDNSICRWLNTDAYRIVKKYDSETRRTAIVAHLSDAPIDDWKGLVGDAAQNLRNALDNLAFALNSKGYAEAHQGAAIPPKDRVDSSFPIIGKESNRGNPIEGPREFQGHPGLKHVPAAARDLIERLQPYQRGENFRQDPLWALHLLSRIDKHQIDIEVSAAIGEQRLSVGTIQGPAALGIAGPVYDGKELSFWHVPKGASKKDTDAYVSRRIAFGEGTELGEAPVVPVLRGVRNYIRYRVAFPLDRFL